MGWTLAITGKGGVGKTTLAALAVRWLGENGREPVLAVDADPNTCLDALLGVKAACTVGGVREEAKQFVQGGMSGGISKQELLDLKIQEALVEGEDFDLIAMGRPEGPGCYCYANNVLRGVLARIAKHYPAVVIDNEAGLENLSRRTVQNVDWLVFVTDPSARGLTTARRLFDLAQEMEISASAMGIVVNRMRSLEALERAQTLFRDTPVHVLGGLPEDDEFAGHDATGKTIFTLPENNAVARASAEIFAAISEPMTAALVACDERNGTRHGVR
ncbi:MAG: AAA family ATPase [Candidatus Hydrogenedentes bacterium]|nr:AAA family ATPase [Candidatus Hydrogenedentota bacterium]